MAYIRLKSKKFVNDKPITVCDIEVEDNHQYLLSNGIVSHNTQDLFSRQVISGGSGLLYNSSINLNFIPTKLDDSENEKAAEKAGLGGKRDTVKNGILVHVKPEKQRFCKPITVRFQIPFFKQINPYIGLEEFINWENGGISRGRIYDEDEYKKQSKANQEKCKEFDFNGEKRYFFDNPRAFKIAVKHLGTDIDAVDLWTSKVFTKEYLKQIDDTIFRPLFELPDQSADDDINELAEELGLTED